MDKELFVQNIKNFCLHRGVKPTNACRESGAGADLINQIERRGSVPSVERVQLLAQYLGVTTSELLGEPPPDTPAFVLRLAEAYGRADAGTRAAVRKLLDVEGDDSQGERG